MNQSQRLNITLSLLIVAAMLVGVGVWMFSTGDLSDDLWYRHELEPNTTSQLVVCGTDTITQDYAWCKGKPITEWRQVFTSFGRHYLHHGNGRLPNFLIYLENMLPSWVFDMMQVLMMGIMAVLMLRIAIPRWQYRPLATVLAMWSIWIVMPWSDQMASTDFMLNYVWSAALNLLFLAAIMGYIRLPRWVIYPLGALTAVMHEGFSVPICAGLLVYWLQQPRNQRRTLLWPILTYAFFSLYVIFPPATVQRFMGASEVDKGPIFGKANLYIQFVKSYMPALTICVMVWYGIKCGWRSLLTQLRELLPFLTIAVVSLCVGLVMRATGRMIWPALTMLLIVCWRLLGASIKQGTSRVVVCNSLAVFLGVVLCAWLCCIGAWQRRAHREMDCIATQMRQTGTDLVYVNTTQRADMPWWLLDIPEFYYTAHPTVRGAHYASLRQREYMGLVALPEQYRGVPLDSLPAVSGYSDLRGEYPFYYSPRYLGDKVPAEFEFGDAPFEPFSGPAALPYLIHAKIQDLRTKGNVIHTYNLNACPVVLQPGSTDTVWFYTPSEFATSDLRRPIHAINIL